MFEPVLGPAGVKVKYAENTPSKVSTTPKLEASESNFYHYPSYLRNLLIHCMGGPAADVACRRRTKDSPPV